MLIEYDGIIRMSAFSIITEILEKYANFYSNYIDISKVKHLDFNNLMRFCVQRKEFSIMESLSLIEFDFANSEKEFSKGMVDLYTKSPTLSMVDSLLILLSQKFLKTVYVYHPEYDPRIHKDLQLLFSENPKVQFVFGDLHSIIKEIPEITNYVFSKYTSLEYCVECPEFKNVEAILASCGYNLKLNSEGELVPKIDNLPAICKDKSISFAQFVPVKMDQSFFTQL